MATPMRLSASGAKDRTNAPTSCVLRRPSRMQRRRILRCASVTDAVGCSPTAINTAIGRSGRAYDHRSSVNRRAVVDAAPFEAPAVG